MVLNRDERWNMARTNAIPQKNHAFNFLFSSHQRWNDLCPFQQEKMGQQMQDNLHEGNHALVCGISGLNMI
jgi:hypothetical protein